LRFKQARDGAALEVLSAAEIATLGDPLFNLLLKDRADVVKLSEVEAAIQGNVSDRRVFVVDERIVSSAQAGSRRAVLTYKGTNRGEDLDGNVMLSVFFGPAGFDDLVEIEAWGWD